MRDPHAAVAVGADPGTKPRLELRVWQRLRAPGTVAAPADAKVVERPLTAVGDVERAANLSDGRLEADRVVGVRVDLHHPPLVALALGILQRPRLVERDAERVTHRRDRALVTDVLPLAQDRGGPLVVNALADLQGARAGIVEAGARHVVDDHQPAVAHLGGAEQAHPHGHYFGLDPVRRGQHRVEQVTEDAVDVDQVRAPAVIHRQREREVHIVGLEAYALEALRDDGRRQEERQQDSQ